VSKIVIKGWRVYGVPDDSNPVKTPRLVALSRKFDVREAAEDFEREVKKVCKWPDTVYVKAVTGFDGIIGDL
jgi:hypothetical protein